MLKRFVKRLPPIKQLVAERDMLLDALGDSKYDNKSLIQAEVAAGRHREAIGGLWDQVGKLQFAFLVARGLEPGHRLLDIGCGSLRGGVHFIHYLEPGNYWGVDVNASLLEAGWNKELGRASLQARQPRHQLVCLQDFEFDALNKKFDFAIAMSVFTHLNFNRIRRCLTRLVPALAPGGKLFATFFEVSIDQDAEGPVSQDQGGVITYSHRDPFHYRIEDFKHAVSRLPLSFHYHGDWNHPRNQKMPIFSARPVRLRLPL